MTTDTAVKRNGTKLLVLHMAAVEILMCGANLPMNYTQTYFASYPSSVLLCTFLQLPFGITRTLANWTDFILSVNRLSAIAFPNFYRKRITNHSLNVVSLVIVWLISTSIFIPFAFGWGARFQTMPPLYACGVQILDGNSIAIKLHVFLTTNIPLGLTAASYLVMLMHVMYRRLVMGRAQRLRTRNRAVKLSLTLCLSAVLRSVCYFPHTVISAYNRALFDDHPMLVAWLRTAFAFGYAGNPVIFFTVHQEYRAALSQWWAIFVHKAWKKPTAVYPVMMELSHRSKDLAAESSFKQGMDVGNSAQGSISVSSKFR
ncbi:rhodopsin-like [Paramacrobiotus metropolitanus]|uniref:rhodopsin-like n=1 Tax=Paramacrobiotus metropolitanus TaxID=2943436 RepID=UPI0024461F29|nr:rhodopsin-like [Paramacrobiotus metropolitanus]